MPVILTNRQTKPLSDPDGEIFRRLRARMAESFIAIVPTRRKVRDLQRRLLREIPDGIAPAFHLHTLGTFAHTLYSQVFPPQHPVKGPTQAILIDEAIRSEASELVYFRLRAGRRLPKGTFEKIVNLINAFKEHGVYPAALHEEIPASDPSEHPILRDILRIYEAYERLLGAAFIDPPGMMKRLNGDWHESNVPGHFKSYYGAVDLLYLSGFAELTDPELVFLFHCADLPGVDTVILFDYHAGNDALFGHLRENYEKLLENGFRKTDIPESQAPDFPAHIRRTLFRSAASTSRYDARHAITVIAAPDRRTEIETVATIIKELAERKPQCDLSRICVAMFRPQIYTKYVREIFERYGIPANITDRHPLDQSPIVISLLAFLSIPIHNYRLNDIMRALSSPYLDVSGGGDPIDAGNLFEVATKLKISAGLSVWRQRITRRRQMLAREIRQTEDEIEGTRLQYEEKQLQRALADLERFSTGFRRFEGPLTPLEFRANLHALLAELCIVERILGIDPSVPGEEHLERDSRAYQKFLLFLDEFLDVLALEGRISVREPLSFYVERLRTALTQVRYNIRQQYGRGITVTSFEETRGLDFDIMFMAGLVDGEFPPVYEPEIFSSASRQARRERYHLTEHRYLFYQALINFTGHLYLTYPRTEDERDTVPSAFIDALMDAVDCEDRREDGESILGRTIASAERYLEFRGRVLGGSGGRSVGERLPLSPPLGGELRDTLDHLHRAVHVERSRAGSDPIPMYHGRIGNDLPEDARRALSRLRDAVFSVTQLETYGRCPFQYFADKILRLAAMEEMEEGFTPRERGGLLHEILFEFYVRRRERGDPPIAGSGDEEYRNATGELFAIARSKLDAMEIDDIFWDVEKEMLFGTSSRRGILREFMDVERSRNLDVLPAYFEVAFGSRAGPRRNADPSLIHPDPIQAGSVRLRGKVDRVELGGNLFTIIDYKSGTRIAKRKDIELGMSLQLPVYLYAVERILASRLGRAVSGVAGTYYTLTSPVGEELGLGSRKHIGKAFQVGARSRQLVADDTELAGVIDQAIGFVTGYVDKIGSGEFPVTPKDPECTCPACSYRTICRIQVQKDIGGGDSA